jgi:hypothetical protein
MSDNKKILHGQLMDQHRKLTNEVSDIKASSFELNESQKKRILELENQIKIIATKLYTLYQ